MYAFAQRADTRVVDEPLYAHYLSVTGAEHPGREAVLAAQSASAEEVVRKANDSKFGLAAGVWTNDIRLGHRMADELEAGVVWVNTYRKSSFTMPFGGFKQSGIGVEKGVEAIDEYLQTKSVWIETEGEVSDPFKLI